MKSKLSLLAFLTLPIAVGCGAATDDVARDAPAVGSEPAVEEAVGSVEQNALFAPNDAFAWVGSTSGTSVPSPFYSSSTGGGTIQATWYDAGRARVDFPNFGNLANGGNVQVVSYGSTNSRCKVEWWGVGAVGTTTLSVYVICHGPTGARTNSPFVVSFDEGLRSGGKAHVWWGSPGSSGAVNSWYSNNANNFVTRNSQGSYTVKLAGQTMPGGNAQVTAYGFGSEYCNIHGWFRSGSDTLVNVACYNTAGALADSAFSLKFLTYGSLYKFRANYVWANDSVSGFYTPDPTYQDYASCTQPNTPQPICTPGSDDRAGSWAFGKYFVDYPEAANIPSHAMVTGYGGSEYCKVESWGSNRVNIACYSPSGQAARSRFTQLFLGKVEFN